MDVVVQREREKERERERKERGREGEEERKLVLPEYKRPSLLRLGET